MTIPPPTLPGRTPVSISPAFGPLPPIYVRDHPDSSTASGLLWPMADRAIRVAAGWALRRIRELVDRSAAPRPSARTTTEPVVSTDRQAERTGWTTKR